MSRSEFAFWAVVGLVLGIALATWADVDSAAAWTFAILLGLIAATIIGWIVSFLRRGP